MMREPQANKGQIFAWSLFDFANTAFYVLILTISYPLYFKEIVAGNSKNGDFLWGLTFSISMCIVAVISPILGAAADKGVSKKWFLAFFTAMCILATCLLYFVHAGEIATGMLLVIIANIGFEAGLVFYDAFLPELSTPQNYGKVSGYGFAMGYLGSLVTLGIAFPLLKGGFGEENLSNIKASFLLAGGMFFLFALPIFFYTKEKAASIRFRYDFITSGFKQVKQTLNDISRYRNVGRFLLSYFLYVDAINTVIIFSSIFARESLKMDIQEIVIFFALVQTSAIAGSAAFGWLSDNIGQKKTLNITLILWLFVVAGAFFTETKSFFFGIGALAGIAMGSSQSSSRSLMSYIIPEEKKTEFFGFYSFFGKASAILGPAIFGLVSSTFNQRAAIVSVGILFLLGFIFLQKVNEQPYSPELSV